MVTGMNWRNQAKCKDTNPRYFDLDSPEFRLTNVQRQARALMLCDGCEVKQQCALEALDPPAIGTARAGVWISAGYDRVDIKARNNALDRLRFTAING